MHMGYLKGAGGMTRVVLGVLLAGVFLFSPAHAQNCTGPDGVPGDLFYNNSFDVFQGCTTRGWMAFHKPLSAPPVDPCTTSSVVGTACADGQTVYAGLSGSTRLYTTKVDQSSAAYWGTYLVDLGANARSTTNGLLNTNTALASIEANPQTGSCNTAPYNPPTCTPNAHLLCKGLRTTLGGDWYLPASNELQMVLTNGAAIGGFSNAYYWSSTEYNTLSAYIRQFPGGASNNLDKATTYRVRCVRQ